MLPRVGMEGSFSRLPRREPRWRELLDRLVARGLCPPEKRDALLAWPGYDTFWSASGAWPVWPRPASGRLRPLLESREGGLPARGGAADQGLPDVRPLRSRPGSRKR